jgi:branched-chain amino acid transport system substrate-binding protein
VLWANGHPERCAVLLRTLLATALALLCVAMVHAQSNPQEVRVGVLLPLSGPVAPTGSEMRRGIDFAVEQINQSGGIRSLNGSKLRVIYADSRGLPEAGMSEAERLILRENVSVLLGAFQSSVTLTSTEVAERYSTPYIVLVSVAPSITQRGFRWVFRATDTADVDARVQMEYLNWVAERTGVRPRTIALVAENSEWGESSSEMTRNALPPDCEIVLDERYSPGTPDFSTLVKKLASLKPDVIFLAAYVADGILLTRTMAEHRISALAILTRGADHGDPAYHEAVKNLGDYQTWIVPFHAGLARQQVWIEPILTDYRRHFGIEMGPFSATAFANVYILKDALERGASAERSRIREALATMRLTQGPAMLLPYSIIEFNSTGQNPHTTLPMVQTVRGRDYIVFPRHLADPDFKPVYPLPGWQAGGKSENAARRLAEGVLSGLTTGSVYAMVALGLSLIFGVMRVIHFAHGALMMVAMYCVYGLWRFGHVHPYAVIPVICALMFLVGYFVQRLLLNNLLLREPETVEPLSPLLVTLGLALVLENLALLLFTPDYRVLQLSSAWSMTASGLGVVDWRRLIMLISACALVPVAQFWLMKSRTGLILRAVAQDRDSATLQGIDVRHAYALAFGLATASVGLAACLLSTFHYIHPTVGTPFLIKGYLVVVLGGMGSLRGTLIAALLVGLMESLVGSFFSANLADVSVFAVFVAFLLIRPSGLARQFREA